jgi:hypothetical protein
MSRIHPPETAPEAPTARRRYIVHLLAIEAEDEAETESPAHFVARIRPWSTRCNHIVEAQEREFRDAEHLVRTINPLLPAGSDVRDVMGHIAGTDGFFYLLQLSLAEAEQLGWRG